MEAAGVFSLDREEAFLEEFSEVSTAHPRVRFVLEHVSTAAAVRRVGELGSNVAATITLHHLEITLDDVIGGTCVRICSASPWPNASRTGRP